MEQGKKVDVEPRYCILKDSDSDELEEAVNVMIDNGWELSGGLSAVSYMSGRDPSGHGDDYWDVLYIQAMSRRVEEKPDRSVEAPGFDVVTEGYDPSKAKL